MQIALEAGQTLKKGFGTEFFVELADDYTTRWSKK
jgi:hypothetical protein